MKTFKDILSEDVYLVKMSNKEGRTMVRQYRGKSEMEVSSKAKVDAKIRGYSVDSVRLMSKEKEVEEAYVASADFKISPSGRKVHKMKKVSDEPTDDDEDEDDKKDIKEAVTVKKANYSWGKMVTVHHGSENSYPLHPEHQKKIASLKDGEKTSFTDETNRKVNAHREGDKVHLSSKDSNKKTTVSHSHFTESVELEEATDKQEQRFLMLARLGLVDKSDVSKLRIAMDQLKADKPLTTQQRIMLLGVMSDLVSLVTGDDTIFNRVKRDIQTEDYTLVEEEEIVLEGDNKQMKGKDPCWKGYQMVGMKDKNGKKVPNCVPTEEKEVEEGYVSDAQRKAVWAARNDAKKEEVDPPFDPDPPKKNPAAKAGKHGQGYSTARHLARLALKKQQEKQAQKAQNK